MKCEKTWEELTKGVPITQDYFNIVSIVCIEKKIPVQSAIEY